MVDDVTKRMTKQVTLMDGVDLVTKNADAFLTTRHVVTNGDALIYHVISAFSIFSAFFDFAIDFRPPSRLTRHYRPMTTTMTNFCVVFSRPFSIFYFFPSFSIFLIFSTFSIFYLFSLNPFSFSLCVLPRTCAAFEGFFAARVRAP